ncbi:MAG: hypothetical protein ACHQYP_06000 [Nitrospiria bacterium]
MKTELDIRIGNKIENLLDDRNLRYKPFAVKNKIDPALFGRLRRGESRWNTTYLEKVSKGLAIEIKEFFDFEMEKKTGNILPLRNRRTTDQDKRFQEFERTAKEIWDSGDKEHIAWLQEIMQVFLSTHKLIKPRKKSKEP